MNPDTLLKIDLGFGAVRERTLSEAVWLWRSGELPLEALHLDAGGEWKPLRDLIVPIIEAEDRQKPAAAELDDPQPGNDPAAAPSRLVSRKAVILAGAGFVFFLFSPLLWLLVRMRPTAKPGELEYERDARREDLVEAHRVASGMTRDQVRRSWGQPKMIATTALSPGEDERWIYQKGTVSFSRGVVIRADTPVLP